MSAVRLAVPVEYVVLLCICLVGCENRNPTGPCEGQPSCLVVHIEQTRVSLLSHPELCQFDAEFSVDSLVVYGWARTSSLAELTASAAIQGTVLRITITRRSSGLGPPMIGEYTYRVSVVHPRVLLDSLEVVHGPDLLAPTGLVWGTGFNE